MKKSGILLLLTIIFMSCNVVNRHKNTPTGETTEVVKNAEEPQLMIINKMQSFGKVNKKRQQLVRLNFEFQNSGNKPLIITGIDVSCGCISTEFPKQPFRKGEKGIIKILVDIKSQKGDFNKSVFVKSNSINKVELLRVKGKVN